MWSRRPRGLLPMTQATTMGRASHPSRAAGARAAWFKGDMGAQLAHNGDSACWTCLRAGYARPSPCNGSCCKPGPNRRQSTPCAQRSLAPPYLKRREGGRAVKSLFFGQDPSFAPQPAPEPCPQPPGRRLAPKDASGATLGGWISCARPCVPNAALIGAHRRRWQLVVCLRGWRRGKSGPGGPGAAIKAAAAILPPRRRPPGLASQAEAA